MVQPLHCSAMRLRKAIAQAERDLVVGIREGRDETRRIGQAGHHWYDGGAKSPGSKGT